MRYNLDANGNINGIGTMDVFAFQMDGTEPFDMDTAFNYFLENGVWKLKPLAMYKYFLIPTDFIAYIEHCAVWVKEVYPQLAFNIICQRKDITIEGASVTMPTSVVNVIPCCVTHWTDEGLMVLAGVIGSWNNQNPSKTIDIPYTFESYNDLIAFRNEHL